MNKPISSSRVAKPIVFLSILLFQLPDALASKTLELKKAAVAIALPNSWRSVAESDHHALLKAGATDGIETTAFINSVKLNPKELSPHAMRLSAGDYTAAKAAKLVEESGIILGTEPYETNLTYNFATAPARAKYYGTGIRYQMGMHAFTERSYFVVCPKKVILMKTISSTRAPASEAVDLVKAIRCI